MISISVSTCVLSSVMAKDKIFKEISYPGVSLADILAFELSLELQVPLDNPFHGPP